MEFRRDDNTPTATTTTTTTEEDDPNKQKQQEEEEVREEDGGQEEEDKEEEYLAIAIPVGPNTRYDAFQRMSWWPARCSSVTRLYIDLVLFYDADQHPGPAVVDALRAYGGKCFRDVRLVLGATVRAVGVSEVLVVVVYYRLQAVLLFWLQHKP